MLQSSPDLNLNLVQQMSVTLNLYLVQQMSVTRNKEESEKDMDAIRSCKDPWLGPKGEV